jgi:hypothetical protein
VFDLEGGEPKSDEPQFTTPVDWPAVTALISGLLRTPRDGSQTIAVESRLGSSLRLRLYGLDGELPDVTEIELLGRPGT